MLRTPYVIRRTGQRVSVGGTPRTSKRSINAIVRRKHVREIRETRIQIYENHLGRHSILTLEAAATYNRVWGRRAARREFEVALTPGWKSLGLARPLSGAALEGFLSNH